MQTEDITKLSQGHALHSLKTTRWTFPRAPVSEMVAAGAGILEYNAVDPGYGWPGRTQGCPTVPLKGWRMSGIVFTNSYQLESSLMTTPAAALVSPGPNWKRQIRSMVLLKNPAAEEQSPIRRQPPGREARSALSTPQSVVGDGRVWLKDFRSTIPRLQPWQDPKTAALGAVTAKPLRAWSSGTAEPYARPDPVFGGSRW